VSRRNFCAPHSVDKLQSGNGAALIIGTQHNPTKYAIAQNSGYGKADAISLLLEYEGRLLCFIELSQPNIRIQSGQQRRPFRETKFEYSIEIFGRDWADCRLSATRNSPLLIQDPAFNRTSWPVERDRIGKIEIGPGLDQREIHSRSIGIGNNSLNPSNRKVAACLSHLARLVVDYPIANAGFNAAEILTGKLISFSRAVIVDRVRSMDKYPKSHDLGGAASSLYYGLNEHFPYSHSIVPGGLLVTSYTTRFTPFTSLMMRVAVSPRNFMSNW